MDPTQAQSDKENDVHSLEHEGDASDSAVTDATGGKPLATAQAPKEKSGLKKFWDKFNIYLLLFFLVLAIAIGVLIASTAKSHQTQTALSSQGLSQDALKQLASTDVTVGNPKQILTVQANAVFAGSVLIRSSLEVAGVLKVGGDLSLNNLTVSGAARLTQADITNLTVAGTMTLQNNLTVRNGINVSGKSNFSGDLIANSISTGALTLNGNLNLTHHITAGGTIPSIDRGPAVGGGGTVSLSGSDTGGTININTGSSPPAGCLATITFSEKYSSTPHVIISPIGSAAGSLEYYVTRSTTNFVICTNTSAASGQSFGFDYIVLG